MSEQIEALWMRDRVVPECAGGKPEPLDPYVTEQAAQAFAVELHGRLDRVVDDVTLARVDEYLGSGRWLAAIGAAASVCLVAGVRVPFRILDFEGVVGCDVHDAILDDIEGVTSCKFLEPENEPVHGANDGAPTK